jgi:hypothetical protein
MRFHAEREIDEFLERFEAGTISKPEWTHQAHLAAAAIYVWRDAETALPHMRFGILFLNRCHGTVNSATSGYHETLTVFWMEIVREFCRERRNSSRLTAINELMEVLPAGLFREYYSFDVVKSRQARERWMNPDLKQVTA